jgi:hypothetical protein
LPAAENLASAPGTSDSDHQNTHDLHRMDEKLNTNLPVQDMEIEMDQGLDVDREGSGIAPVINDNAW